MIWLWNNLEIMFANHLSDTKYDNSLQNILPPLAKSKSSNESMQKTATMQNTATTLCKIHVRPLHQINQKNIQNRCNIDQQFIQHRCKINQHSSKLDQKAKKAILWKWAFRVHETLIFMVSGHAFGGQNRSKNTFKNIDVLRLHILFILSGNAD